MAQFNTDLEGPITKNDNAFELASHFLPNGDRFFKLISRYDDILADILEREDYKAGDTLRLILPFFAAYEVSEKKMETFSKTDLRFVPDAKETITKIRKVMPTFIISTSYSPYVKSVCKFLDFPIENTYSTQVNLSSKALETDEINKLREIYSEIQALPMIEIPSQAYSLEDFSADDQDTIRKLDEIFWERIWNMGSGYFLKNVNPVGGKEKASSVLETLKKTGNDLRNVIYVGDSITDFDALSLVKSNGGLAVSFNGNKYAFRSCDIAIIAKSFWPLYEIAKVFEKNKKKQVLKLVRKRGFKQARVTAEIDSHWIRESEKMRKDLRGVKVAELG